MKATGVIAATERLFTEQAPHWLFGFAAGGSGILSSVAAMSNAPRIHSNRFLRNQQIHFTGVCSFATTNPSVSQTNANSTRPDTPVSAFWCDLRLHGEAEIYSFAGTPFLDSPDPA